MSEFRLQIVHEKDGFITRWEPGREFEYDLIDSLVSRVAAKGVGVGCTTAHVLEDVRMAFLELLFDIKSEV